MTPGKGKTAASLPVTMTQGKGKAAAATDKAAVAPLPATASPGIFPKYSKSRYFDGLGRLMLRRFACYRPLFYASTRHGLG
jgi:hypothetical protein